MKMLKEILMLQCLGISAMAMAEGPVTILDTPEIVAQMEVARHLTRNDPYLLITQRLQCRDLDENGVPTEAPEVNTDGTEVYAEPTKLFDNLYYVGGQESGSWIFTTSDGYIMIDAGYSYSPEELIIPGMQQLGLDPSQIKYILITHAGPDHVGGAKYFQDHYGTHIVMSEQDWGTKGPANIQSANENQVTGALGIEWPTRDIVATDGQQLTLGDTTVTIVQTPRRVNGGGLSYIIPVSDHRKPHMWATYGNTNVVGTHEDKMTYQDAVTHFMTYTDEAKVDVVISSHPFVDGSIERMDELRNRKPGEPNPFVMGRSYSRRYFEILKQCAVVLTAREDAGLNETGTAYVE